MNSGAIKRAFGLTFLYIGIFVLIVIVQFSRGPGFSEKFDQLSVRATYPRSGRGDIGLAPDALKLNYAGFQIAVDAASPVELLGPDGTAKAVGLKSVDRIKGGVRVRLEGGTEFRVTVDASNGESYALAANAPDGSTGIRLRYSLVGGARLRDMDGHPVLDSGRTSFDLSLPSTALARDKGLLVLDPRDPSSSSIAFVRRLPAQGKPTPPKAPDTFIAQAPKDPASFKAEIAAWRDKVWAGLSSTRFDPDRVTWSGPDGSARFSERALVAYYAEALARDAPSEVFARVRGARERWPDRLSYLSAPYVGGLLPKMQALEAADLVEVKRLSQLIQDKSPALFEKENLIHFLLDRSPFASAQDALRYAAGIDPSKLSVRQAVGLLGCMVESRSYLKDEENPFKAFGATADRIVASVRKTGSGFFLVTDDDGSTDMRISLLAGSSLLRYGANEGKDMLVGVGQSLVEGVLGLGDTQGFAPAKAVVKAGDLEQKSGSLAPEDIYPLIAGNPYYAKEVSFYRDIAPGAWSWTCSPSLTVDAKPNRYVFTAEFPQGRAHYMAFYGMKAFTNIQLYDIDYNPDNDFESYDASGYLYRKPTSALYVKMKHKKESETIKLFF
ncbi:MAG TPA: hypothetical protein VFL04_05165 [Rectinemataceae bacterium]|nr:hypothetical protein [Rectinemataceae bacterium]